MFCRWILLNFFLFIKKKEQEYEGVFKRTRADVAGGLVFEKNVLFCSPLSIVSNFRFLFVSGITEMIKFYGLSLLIH